MILENTKQIVFFKSFKCPQFSLKHTWLCFICIWTCISQFFTILIHLEKNSQQNQQFPLNQKHPNQLIANDFETTIHCFLIFIYLSLNSQQNQLSLLNQQHQNQQNQQSQQHYHQEHMNLVVKPKIRRLLTAGVMLCTSGSHTSHSLVEKLYHLRFMQEEQEIFTCR